MASHSVGFLISLCIQKGSNIKKKKKNYFYLLLLFLPSHVALLDAPVAKEVSEVAEDGEDAVAHVGEHGHQ